MFKKDKFEGFGNNETNLEEIILHYDELLLSLDENDSKSRDKVLLMKSKAEKTLSEYKIQTQVLNSLPPIGIIDLEYNIIAWNKNYSNCVNLEEDKKCHQLTHGENLPCNIPNEKGEFEDCPLDKVIQTKKEYKVEHLHKVKTKQDGKIKKKFFDILGIPLFDEKGKINHLLELTTDVTHRKKLEEKLNLFKEGIEHAGDGIIFTNTDLKIVYANPEMCDMSGYQIEELIGETPCIFKTNGNKHEVYTELWEKLNQNKTWEGVFKNKKKTGEEYSEKNRISPVFNQLGC